MAGSNDSNTTDNNTAASSSENDSDKLDDMLNEAESSMDDSQEEDEVIERLLVDDASADEKEAIETAKDEFDEFAEESDDLEQSMQEIDTNVESEAENNSSDEFLMADFDISADDDFSDEAGEEQKESLDTQNEQKGDEVKGDEVGDVAPPEVTKDVVSLKQPVSAQSEEAMAKTEAEIDGLKAQINELWAENKTQEGQVAALMEAVNSEEKYESIIKEIGSIQTEQQKLTKSLKQDDNKIPIINYIAIGIAVLALLVGGILGGIGYGAKFEVADLSELFTTFEEEVGLFTNKDSTVEIEKLNDKVILLTTEADQLKKQVLEIDQAIKSNSSQAGVVENTQLQQTVEQLVAKVTVLEKRKFVSTTKPRIVAAKKVKTPTAKASWVVNLVSFKQEWFAKRKASEFDGKGVATEVLPVVIKGEKWFRLRVVGFKSKYEAATYAVKVKKSLNLSAVWVAKDQQR